MPGTGQGTSGGGGPLRMDAPRLGDAANAAENATTGQFRPDVKLLYEQYRVGTPFGKAHQGSAMMAARTAHHECLLATSAVLSEYVGASSLLVAAVREVLANYSAADMSSDANNQAVSNILANAILQADATRKATNAENARMARADGPRAPALPGENAL